MPGTLYRVKLYGHSSSDTELFCKNLATVLNIDAESAQALLLDTPAVIKESVEKEKAEEICRLLEPIRALCIVEPVNGEIDDDSPIASQARAVLSEVTEAVNLEKKATLRSWVWLVALGAAFGAFLLFFGVGFVSSLWHVYRHNRPAATSPAQSPASTDSRAESESVPDGPISIAELQDQIDTLEARIASNRFRLGQAEEALGALYRSPRSRNKDFEEQGLIIRDLRTRIRSDVAQLQVLQRKLGELQSGNE